MYWFLVFHYSVIGYIIVLIDIITQYTMIEVFVYLKIRYLKFSLKIYVTDTKAMTIHKYIKFNIKYIAK